MDDRWSGFGESSSTFEAEVLQPLSEADVCLIGRPFSDGFREDGADAFNFGEFFFLGLDDDLVDCGIRVRVFRRFQNRRR